MELSREFRDKFVRNLNGRDFILYGGVLQLAKERGLKRIATRIVQLPHKDNGYYAVCEAEVETDDGVFSDVGDASPASVSRTIQPHLLRMAATRAKARAMRDAVGIEMVALEELGGDADTDDTVEEPAVEFGPAAPARAVPSIKFGSTPASPWTTSGRSTRDTWSGSHATPTMSRSAALPRHTPGIWYNRLGRVWSAPGGGCSIAGGTGSDARRGAGRGGCRR